MDETTIKLIEKTLGVTINFGAFIVTWVLLSFLGTRVKRIPAIENDFIPLVLALVGSFTYVGLAWLLGSPLEKSGFVVGFVNGFAAVGGHQFLIRTKQAITGEVSKEPPKDPPVTTP